MPGISNQYNQFLHNKMPQIGVGIGICKSNVKNVLDGLDMSTKNTEHISSNIIPPSQLFYCEGCEKEFTQKSAYDAHCANHETCRHPGCSFSGTKKVVIAHFHGSHGLYSGEGYKMIEVEGSNKKYRVLLGVSPIEIEKWRMDRRKNFPTSENTQKKLEQKEELRKAGGLVIEKGKKRKRNDAEEGQGKNQKNANDFSGTLDINQINNIVDENGTIVGVKNNENNESIEGENKDDKEDKEDKEEDGEENKDFKLRKKPCVFFVRGTCKQGDSCTYSHDFEIKVCNFFVRSGRCTRGNKCTFSHNKEERAKFLEEKKLGNNNDKKNSKSENQNDDKNKNKNEDNEDNEVDNDDESKEKNIEKKNNKLNKNRNKDKDKGQSRGNMKEKEELNDDALRQKAMKKKGQLFLPKPFAGGSRGTLLRNLLLHEVEVEENILLQCLRLIVTNNYLQPVE